MTTTLPLTGVKGRSYTAERLDIEYSPAKWHSDRADTLHRHHVLGERAVETCHPTLDIRYGPGPLQTLDLFPSVNRSDPCCVIVHGGFWRISDKAAFHFIAGALSRQGFTCVVPNCDLCPAISIADMVGQICDALTWTVQNTAIGGEANGGIILFGHATGAHLAAMSLMASCPRTDRPWLSRMRGSLLISGLYDLRRIPELDVNNVLRVDDAMAEALSPFLSCFCTKAPVVVASAQEETFEFQCQSADFAEAARRQGVPTELMSVPNVGHFTVLDDLSTATGPCMDALLRLSGGSGLRTKEILS